MGRESNLYEHRGGEKTRCFAEGLRLSWGESRGDSGGGGGLAKEGEIFKKPEASIPLLSGPKEKGRRETYPGKGGKGDAYSYKRGKEGNKTSQEEIVPPSENNSLR